jgi:hypothetical protein
MILSSAVLVGASWERLLGLRLEQRRVAGREPPSEQQSEGQRAYLADWRVHLHPHREPITATRLTDLLLTVTRSTEIQATRSRAMDTRVIRDIPPTPVLPVMDTRARRSTLPTPVLVMEIRWLAIPAIALGRTGRVGASTPSSPLAEFRPKFILSHLSVAGSTGSGTALSFKRSDPSPDATGLRQRIVPPSVINASLPLANLRQMIDRTCMI